ncbi:MAG: hypothetical protein A2571_03665 [Candidatus Vogelbacteria bacterium RIFOXYD1_FULL_44_32]|uniref:Uncharacterized protein n=1 Tax=Candidatus Vogelbacteria bacterium RIFOXYD1_FULL_44_32 TaxID=1802438 RepID=A0A1G2QDD9_9BACT|nr:MAG: hypothetical protein A2571_03665 [Candidatus Vogelbacteria bacterium RIFOXYD1_FULL_44_32]
MKIRKKWAVGLGVLVLFIGGYILANLNNSSEVFLRQEVVFLRSVYKSAGNWYLVVDKAETEPCANSLDCDQERGRSLAGLVTYTLPRHFEAKLFFKAKAKKVLLTPTRLASIIATDSFLQNTAFVLVLDKEQVVSLTEVYDPLF